MTSRQTALGKLLQDSREAAGLSRIRAGELVGISPGTIEGWELGRVAKPPIHDVLRLTNLLGIPADEIQRAVLEDTDPPLDAAPGGQQPRRRGRPRGRGAGAVPLLEAAFRLFHWKDDSDAAAALQSTPEQVSLWRRGAEPMDLADYMTLTSMVGIAAAAAIKGDQTSTADLDAAAHTLGLRPRMTKPT